MVVPGEGKKLSVGSPDASIQDSYARLARGKGIDPGTARAQVGVTRQTINSIEKARFHPNLRLAFRIARVFGKRVAEVFIYEDI